MPYIEQHKRNQLEGSINSLAKIIRSSHEVNKDRNGQMNYTISQLIQLVYGHDYRYADINDVVGMLTCAKDEFYAKIAQPYERIKETENGGVYWGKWEAKIEDISELDK